MIEWRVDLPADVRAALVRWHEQQVQAGECCGCESAGQECCVDTLLQQDFFHDADPRTGRTPGDTS